ncbi:hypothetical protein [Nocardia altamirensis]|uniref:hypothetical protein n=1 Tax=Nocardia altamirensis TaxID=472158 RepID=UPI0008404A44|nr:hypothetical protein [Nocardia altamirensis]
MLTAKRTATAVATLGAVATAIALAAPQAGATVTSIRVESGQSSGSSGDALGTGCSYSVVAKTEPGRAVVFLDEFNADVANKTFQPAYATADATGTARTTWVPNQKGPHKIWAIEYLGEEKFDPYTHDVPYTVGTGVNVGPTCVVLP